MITSLADLAMRHTRFIKHRRNRFRIPHPQHDTCLLMEKRRQNVMLAL